MSVLECFADMRRENVRSVVNVCDSAGDFDDLEVAPRAEIHFVCRESEKLAYGG